MNPSTSQAFLTKPDYGIDAPGVRLGMFLAGFAGLGLFLVSKLLLSPGITSTTAATLALTLAIYGFFMASYMTYSSRIAKLRNRETLLDIAASLRPWQGTEDVLDVGCGRGLMAIAAAKRLTSGKAIGIDLWSTADQSGNSPQAAQNNARCEGVGHKLLIQTGDARHLPYQDSSFDLVLSHWMLHNLPQEADRQQALSEMLRVLRPGGVLVLADIAFMEQYRRHLAALGASRLRFEDGGWEARIMGLLSGGSYRPQALAAQREPGASERRK